MPAARAATGSREPTTDGLPQNAHQQFGRGLALPPPCPCKCGSWDVWCAAFCAIGANYLPRSAHFPQPALSLLLQQQDRL